ncbi:MAG: hypothetical protein POH28_08745 [Acidocella sp.]|nr:hypothetical protein [Acidocella sp.]
MTPKTDLPRHGGAFLVYLLCTLVLIDHGVSITNNISGQGSDTLDSTWFLAWWPWAISHHIDPFFTRLQWYPVGVPLAWVTSVPLLAVLGWPVTSLAGPVVTYNLLIILAPLLASWCAYLLCYRLTADLVASLIGGFLFGFSSYEMGQTAGALNLSFICALPLIVYVILARHDGQIGRPATSMLLGGLLIAQFLICIEIAAFIVIFGALSWVVAMIMLPTHRHSLQRLIADSIIAGLIVLAVVWPFLLSMWRHARLIHHPDFWPFYFTADLANIVIPTRRNLWGAMMPSLSHNFGFSLDEQDAYIGLPLLYIIWRFARDHAALDQRRYLRVIFLILLVASLGPRPWLNGHYLPVFLPWMLMVHVPVLSNALPTRFALFISLVTAIIAALWIAAGRQRMWRVALGCLACLSIMPDPHPWTKIPSSSFFAPNEVTKILGPNPRLLILPFALNGPSSFWQQESRFSFTETGGYLGFPPRPVQNFPVVFEMFGNAPGPDFIPELTAYCQHTQTQYVVAGPGTSPAFLADLARTSWAHRAIDDVILYKVPNARR